MRPMEQLKEEHEGIKLILKIMDKISDKLKSAQELNQAHFTKILEFLKIFVDQCHHGKEEDLFLPAMIAAGVPEDKGVIVSTLLEHEEARGYVKNMREAFDDFKNGDCRASAKIVGSIKTYITLLIRHIDKENNILFSMADNVLSKTAQDELEEGFKKLEVERIGFGQHEEFHRLLYHLKEIYTPRQESRVLDPVFRMSS